MITIKKFEIIKSNKEFNNIINNNNILENECFLIHYEKSDSDYPRFGIAVGKRIGNAVNRNHLKRQIRNIIDNNKFIFKNNINYIIMIKKRAEKYSFDKKNKRLLELLENEERHEK